MLPDPTSMPEVDIGNHNATMAMANVNSAGPELVFSGRLPDPRSMPEVAMPKSSRISVPLPQGPQGGRGSQGSPDASSNWNYMASSVSPKHSAGGFSSDGFVSDTYEQPQAARAGFNDRGEDQVNCVCRLLV